MSSFLNYVSLWIYDSRPRIVYALSLFTWFCYRISRSQAETTSVYRLWNSDMFIAAWLNSASRSVCESNIKFWLSSTTFLILSTWSTVFLMYYSILSMKPTAFSDTFICSTTCIALESIIWSNSSSSSGGTLHRSSSLDVTSSCSISVFSYDLYGALLWASKIIFSSYSSGFGL